MKTTKIATIALLLTATAALTGCKEEQKPIVGKWEMTGAYVSEDALGATMITGHPLSGYSNCTVSFAEDGTGSMTNNDSTTTYQWSMKEDNTLLIDNGDSTEKHHVLFYSQDTEMNWIDTVRTYTAEDGKTMVTVHDFMFKRINESN